MWQVAGSKWQVKDSHLLSATIPKGDKMFSVTHFRSEFVRQNQAAILRKVTMTQFMLVIVLTAIAVGLLNAPLWLTPLFIVVGYAAGYTHNGEILIKRLVAYLTVWLRRLVGAPQIVNVQAEWDSVRVRAERQQIGKAFAATVVVEG